MLIKTNLKNSCCGNCASFDNIKGHYSCDDSRNIIITNPSPIRWCVYWKEEILKSEAIEQIKELQKIK